MHRGFGRDDLMAILEGVDDAVVKLDGQARFVAMNQAAANVYQQLGLDPQVMNGKSVWEVFPELKGTVVERELRHLIEDHLQVSYEFIIPKISAGTKPKGIQLPAPSWFFGTSLPGK